MDLILTSVAVGIAALGFISNVVMCAMVFAIKRLQKTHNAFFIHHVVLDLIKCIYVFIFTKVI